MMRPLLGQKNIFSNIGFIVFKISHFFGIQWSLHLRIIIFWPKGGSGRFLGENADTQNSFFSSDFDPISGLYIYKYIDFHLKYNYMCPNWTFTTHYRLLWVQFWLNSFSVKFVAYQTKITESYPSANLITYSVCNMIQISIVYILRD